MEFSETLDSQQQGRIFRSIDEFRMLQELPGSRPLAMVDADGKILYATQSFSTWFGLSQGHLIADLLSEPALNNFIQGLERSNYRGIQIDIMAGKVEGELEGFMVDMERVLIGNKELLLLLFTFSAERVFFENRINTLHNALDYGNIPVIITDLKGNITYSTRSFEDIVGKKIDKIFHAYFPQTMEALIPEEENYFLCSAIENKLPWHCMVSGTGADGTMWFKEIQLTPVIQETTNLNHFIITAHDITHHLQKNFLIRQSEERQRSIINNISDMLLILKADTAEITIDNANDNFLDFIGMTKFTAIGRQAEKILQPDMYLLILNSIPAFNEPGKVQLSVPFLEKIRQRSYTLKMTYTDDINEDYRYYIITLTDITEQIEHEDKLQRAYEKETQLNKLKSAFLANMSHEIRTPSMAIIGYANLLCDDISDGIFDSVKEMTGYLRDGVKRMLKLIDNIVEVSMIESGDYNFQFENKIFNELVEASFKELIHLAADKQVTISLDFDENCKDIVTDESKFKKIFEAVIDNAIKYNSPGGRVVIKTVSSSTALTAYISDTGRGIDEKKIDKILEPFVQEEDEGHKRRYEGAGLGLTIAYRLTKALKGELKVKSQSSEGTTVIIKFPLKQQD